MAQPRVRMSADAKAPANALANTPAKKNASANAPSVIHKLYVGEETDGGASLSVLRYLAAHKSMLLQMGIRPRATLVRAADLQPRLLAALEKKGITRLPALLTAQSVYTGAQAILDLYDRNIKAFAAANGTRAPAKPRPAKLHPR